MVMRRPDRIVAGADEQETAGHVHTAASGPTVILRITSWLGSSTTSSTTIRQRTVAAERSNVS